MNKWFVVDKSLHVCNAEELIASPLQYSYQTLARVVKLGHPRCLTFDWNSNFLKHKTVYGLFLL